MFENLEEEVTNLFEYLFKDIYWDLGEEEKFVLRCYREDFEEYFLKKGLTKYSERLKELR